MFTVFRCFPVEGLGSFLVMDFNTKCGSEQHLELQIVGWICLCIYTIGFPIYLLFDLKRTKKWHHKLPSTTANSTEEEKRKNLVYLEKHHMVKMRLGSLYHSFEKEYWWFEIAIIFEKMLLVGALGVVAIGSPLQLMLAVMVCITFLLMRVRTAPFDSPHLDVLNFCTSLSLSLTLFAAFTKAMDEMDRKPRHHISNTILGIMLIIVNLFPFLYAICMTLYRFVLKRKAMTTHLKRKISRNMTKIKPLDTCNMHSTEGNKQSEIALNAKRAWEVGKIVGAVLPVIR